MDRIFCIDKPQGFTSFDVVAKLRGILGQRKVGHGGTLDPMATGVLPVFAGRAARVTDLMPCNDKRYTAAFQLGIATDTLDITGEVTQRMPVDVGEEDVKRALTRFKGEIHQIPPMYSAVKIGGRKLYDLARRGEVAERPPRKITIYEINLISSDKENNRYTIDVTCSKGTYVRSLCDDVGHALGTCAVLTELRRTQSGIFTEKDVITLADMQRYADEGTLEEKGFSVDAVFADYPRADLTEENAVRFVNGAPVYDFPRDEDSLRIYGPFGDFLGIGTGEDGILRVKKLFAWRG